MNPVPRQMPLVFEPRPALGREDFLVSPANAAAVALIDGWRDWPCGRIALAGPRAAGKTHLAHVWMADSGAALVEASSLRETDVPLLAARGKVVIEDADRLEGLGSDERRAAEAALFHLYNLLAAEGGRLLVTGRGAPSDWPILTPDLASRLQSLSVARIEAPDDALLSSILVKLFADRQLQVGPEVVNYLVTRIDRSFAAAERAVAALDAMSLGLRRPVSRHLAIEYLRGAAPTRNDEGAERTGD